MVLPPELERKNQNARTLEQQLTDKFFQLQTAREERYTEGSDVMFDEVAKSIETLLRAIPEAFNLLITKRSELDSAFEEERNTIYQEVSRAPDDITKDFLWNQRIGAAKWEYRELYEELIMDVMQTFQLIHMSRPPQVAVIPSQVQTQQQEYVEPDSEPNEQQPMQQVPMQQQPMPQQPLPQAPPEKRKMGFALLRKNPKEPNLI
jgi:hypothetical protein